MLNITYLRNILSTMPSVTDADEQIIDSPDGLEGLVELCQHKDLPFVILFEDAYHFDDFDANDTPVTRFSQSIYAMRMVGDGENARDIENLCMADLKRIRSLLTVRYGEGDPEIAGWDRRPQRDYVSGASNYVGWKIRITFVEDEDWNIEDQIGQ